jgi:hypothetical protein
VGAHVQEPRGGKRGVRGDADARGHAVRAAERALERERVARRAVVERGGRVRERERRERAQVVREAQARGRRAQVRERLRPEDERGVRGAADRADPGEVVVLVQLFEDVVCAGGSAPGRL